MNKKTTQCFFNYNSTLNGKPNFTLIKQPPKNTEIINFIQYREVFSIIFYIQLLLINYNIFTIAIPAKVWDYNETKDSTEQQKQLINIIFTVICAIAMILSFFSLVSAMTANIMEQTKEIAILRAVGLTTLRMKTIYFFEAFTLVFSSCIIGVMVGIAIGFTMSMQRSLFTDLPIQFSFPYLMLLVMLCASVVCAFFSTIIPTSKILKNKISHIIRMTS